MKPHWERRTTTRHACRVEAILFHDGERSHAMILDYHDTGLQLWVRDVLVSGTDVQICVDQFNVAGRVLWYQQKAAGVALLNTMEEAFRVMLDEAKAASLPPD